MRDGTLKLIFLTLALSVVMNVGSAKAALKIEYRSEHREIAIKDGSVEKVFPASDFEATLIAALEVTDGIWKTRPPVTVYVDMYRSWPPFDSKLYDRQRRQLLERLDRWTDFLRRSGVEDKARARKIASLIDKQSTRSEGAGAIIKWVNQDAVKALRRILETRKPLPEWAQAIFTTAFHAKPWAGEFRTIPAGKFLMGSPPDEPGRFELEDQHGVVISKPFDLQSTHVTQEDWFTVTGYNPAFWHKRGDCPKSHRIEQGVELCPRQPVEMVSWIDVQRFLKSLNARGGPHKYRLPTEAEWEYAARGGSSEAFFFGSDITKLGLYSWSLDNSGGHPHDVAQKLPNPYGLYDMFGNVWHWMSDYYGPYPKGEVVDPTGPKEGVDRCARGGAWNEYASTAPEEYQMRGENKPCPMCDHKPGKGKIVAYRSAYRMYITEDYRFSDEGFRIVREKR